MNSQLADYRMAVREEGAMLNAYWVPRVGSPADLVPAALAMSIPLDVVKAQPALHEGFLMLLNAVSIELLALRHGVDRRTVSGFQELDPGPRGTA